MKSCFVILSSLLLSFSAQAAIFHLDASGAEPVYQTTLPKEVYQYSSEHHLNDLTITNAEGEAIPYAVVPYKRIYPQTQVTKQTKQLVIFPMHAAESKSAEVASIQLNTNDHQTSVNVTSHENQGKSKQYFLFDLGKKHPAFTSLSLDWEGQEGKLLTVDVMTSQNLNDWKHVGDATLLKVSANNQVIEQNNVTVNTPIKARYLQIRPKEATDTLTLTSVKLEFNQVKNLPLPMLWEEISPLQRDQNQSETTIDFESPSRYPATHLMITLPQKNTITHATIMTRNSNDKPWRTIKSAALYHLNKNDQQYTNKPITIPTTTARYWRLNFAKTKGGIGNENPQLSLGWVPDTMVWNARGSAPYTLQVGDVNNTKNKVALNHLLKPNGALKIQQLPVSNMNLTETSQPLNTWDKQTDNKRQWLWAGLLLGVAALASMVYSLLKQKPN